MKHNKTLTSSILTIIFSSIWLIANAFITFVLWLVLGIGNSLDENFSAPIQSIVIVVLLVLGLISISNIVIASVTIKRYKDVNNPKTKVIIKTLIAFLFISLFLNIVLSVLIGGILLILMYALFGILNLVCAVMLIIDIKNKPVDKTENSDLLNIH